MKKFCYDFDNPKYKILKNFKKIDNEKVVKKLNVHSQKTLRELEQLKFLRKLQWNELKRMEDVLFRASSCGQDDYQTKIYQLYVYKTRLIGIFINDVFVVISIFKK